MLGIVFSLLSAASFALNGVTVRRGVLASSASQGLYISVLMGVPLFALAALLAGEIAQAGRLSLMGHVGLAAAGILHFLFGRYCNYRAVGAIGANRVEPIRGTSLLYSVAIAVLVLGEELTFFKALGVAMIMTSALLMVHRPAPKAAAAGPAVVAPADAPKAAPPPRLVEGYVFGFGASLAYGLSPVLIRGSLEGTGLATYGGLVSYVAAAAVLLLSLARPGRAGDVKSMGRGAAGWFLLAGGTVFLAQFFRYLALAVAPVVVVTPLTQTTSLFTLVFSWLMNRRLESFAPNVILGVILTFLGAIAVVS